MFHKNDVISWRGSNYRLLSVVEDQVALYPMSATGLAVVIEPVSELNAAEKSGAAVLVNDPFEAIQHKTPKGRAVEKMEQTYGLIRPLLDQGDAILTSAPTRNKALMQISGGNASLRRKAVRALAAFWKKGQSENVLQPEYGKNTDLRNCLRKPGRRFKNKDINPPAVNDELRAQFRRIIDRYVLKQDGISLQRAHALLVNDYIKEHPGSTAATAPSFNQFRYFYRTYKTFPEKLRAKTPDLQYDKDKRTLHGTVYDIVHGVGQIYEIDSTVTSVYLVSEQDRKRLIGQPTLYVVTDVYSRVIVGVHVAIEAAQFETAAAALAVAIGDKKPILDVFSDGLQPVDWNISGIPSMLAADNAELSGRQIESFCRSCSVQISNTKAYRGDQKGVVERTLGLVQERIDPVIEAKASESRLKKEGRKDNRGKASLTLSDYLKIILNAVMDLNNRVLCDPPPDYPAELDPTPIAVWNWCHRPGGGRSFLRRAPKQDILRQSLMPRFDATISREGIKAQRITYDCERARELGWFERDRNAPRPEAGQLAIDPNNVGSAWYFEQKDTSPTQAWPCTLSASCRRFEGMPLFEVRSTRDLQHIAATRAEMTHKKIQGTMYRRNEEIVKQAKDAQPGAKKSLKADVEALAQNRYDERGYQARKSQGEEARKPPRPKAERPSKPYEFPDDFDDLTED